MSDEPTVEVPVSELIALRGQMGDNDPLWASRVRAVAALLVARIPPPPLPPLPSWEPTDEMIRRYCDARRWDYRDPHTAVSVRSVLGLMHDAGFDLTLRPKESDDER